jgi:undecaprenyl pyrophosphate phosphatase UppP
MASQVESISSEGQANIAPGAPRWFKVGALTAVSAMAGGMAVAWYYRKTLIRLRQAEDLQHKEEIKPSFTGMGDDS